MRYSLLLVLNLGVGLGAQAQSARPRQPLLAQELPATPALPDAAPTTYQLRGRVYNPAGRPLPGATIQIKGTDTVVSTDANGSFIMRLPAQASTALVVGYLGYEEQPVRVLPGQPLLNVSLRPNAISSATPAHALRAGELAPDFALPSSTGSIFRLSEHRGHPVVLYFYPKDGSPGCTKEACSFRDQYQAFVDKGAEVVGISSDDSASHLEFANRHELPFPLLSDTDGQLRKQYVVPRAMLGLLPGRVTYVLDSEGRVRYVFSSLNDATGHAQNAQDILRGLK